MAQPVVTVIVPSFRRPEHLRRCLVGLSAQTSVPDEVIVVIRDNDRETARMLETLPLSGTVIHAPLVVTVTQPGVLAALDAGFAHANGEIIALTDDDATPHPDWLANLLLHYGDARVACVGGRDVQVGEVVEARQVGVVQPWGRLVGEHHRGRGRARRVDHLRGVNMSLRRTSWRIDKRLRGKGAQYAWELDICLGARRAGRDVIYDPNALVDHDHGVRYDADQRDAPSLRARVERVHNETYLLLKWLPAGRGMTVFGYGLLVGTRFAPGPLLVAERFAAGDLGAIARAGAGFLGRLASLVTLARASRDPAWRRETHR